jgi:hypothetical protein
LNPSAQRQKRSTCRASISSSGVVAMPASHANAAKPGCRRRAGVFSSIPQGSQPVAGKIKQRHRSRHDFLQEP